MKFAELFRNKMKKITLSIFALFLISSFIHAQTKTVKGNFCGMSSGGNAFVYSGVRVGKRVFEYSEHINSVKYFGFDKKNSKKIGAEYVIKYKTDGEVNWAVSVTFTGRVNPETKPCSIE